MTRQQQHLAKIARAYPLWKHVDFFLSGRGKSLPDWPSWCFLPMAAAYSVVAADAGVERLDHGSIARAGDIAPIAALAAWRVTQGVYRYDPDLLRELVATPVAGDIPSQVLHHLPEWCVYVELEEMVCAAGAVHGVYAHMEWDANSRREELRLLVDAEEGFVPIPIHLGAWTLEEAISRAVTTAQGHSPVSMPSGIQGEMAALAEPILSVLLYLCSRSAEIGDGSRVPSNPSPKKVKGGARLFPAPGPTVWDVGVRLGAALRAGMSAARDAGGDGAGTHARPRPHIRRAHWHGFWLGPKSEPDRRTFDLRWLPPIPVAVESLDQLPVTVRAVRR